jgi:hypothetical protein
MRRIKKGIGFVQSHFNCAERERSNVKTTETHFHIETKTIFSSRKQFSKTTRRSNRTESLQKSFSSSLLVIVLKCGEASVEMFIMNKLDEHPGSIYLLYGSEKVQELMEFI